MSVVEDLEERVQKLAPEEFTQFRDWFSDFQWRNWDQQLERDVAAGKLDHLLAKAKADYRAGRTRPL
jgi:hypothetical protein